MERKTVFNGNKFTVNFGKADAEPLKKEFLTSTLLSALNVNVELTDLVPEIALAKSVLVLSGTGHFDFEKYLKVIEYLLEDYHEKAN